VEKQYLSQMPKRYYQRIQEDIYIIHEVEYVLLMSGKIIADSGSDLLFHRASRNPNKLWPICSDARSIPNPIYVNAHKLVCWQLPIVFPPD